MRSRTSIGLIGCGLWGRNILRDLRELGGEVAVIETGAEARSGALAAGARSAGRNLGALPEVDGIVVATPATTHAEIVSSLLPRGVPVLVEKPLATDEAAAERLAREGAGRLFVGHVWRYHPGVEMLGAIARSGELGSVTGLRSTRANWTSPRKDVDSIWNLAPHDLALAIEILGDIPPPRAAVADMHDGRAVGMTALLGTEPWQVFEVSNRHATKRREARLHCRDGTAVMDDPEQGFVEIVRGADRASPHIERRKFGTDAALKRELAAFVGHVRGGPPPKSDAAEGLAVVRAVVELRRLAGLSPA